jgi:hypothetical protein
MKTLDSFKAQARRIVADAHRLYAFAEGLKNTFTEIVWSTPVAYAAGTDFNFDIGVVPEAESDQAWGAVKASVTSPSLVTGATATAETFTLGYSRAGAARVSIATLVTITGLNLAADTEVSFTVLAAAASLLAGDVLTLQKTHVGAGITIPAGVVVKVELQ